MIACRIGLAVTRLKPCRRIRFFHKLEGLEKNGGGPEWLQDHPLTPSRIDKAEQVIADHDYRYGK